MKWHKTPKGYVAIAMAVYLLAASIGSQDIRGVVNGLAAVGAALVMDMICCAVKKRKRIMPDGALITGLIIGLILSTSTSWIIASATSVIAILSKHLLTHKKKPVLNPAAFGLLVSVLVFQTGQSWWGSFADLSVWMTAFLLIGGYFVAGKANKFPQVFCFLAAYLVLLFVMGLFQVGDAADAVRPPFINAALFFAFFMLTDPPTSPAKYGDQAIFGILAAVVGAVVYAIFGGLMYLFIGLLSANVYYYLKSKSAAPGVARIQKSAQ